MKKIQLLLCASLCLFLFSCHEDSGTITVTYQEATPVYGDLEEIRNLTLNVAPQEIDNPGKIYITNDIILIGEETEGVHVMDNTDPSSPQAINFINIPGTREFFVKDNFLYAESYYDVVKLDITNPRDVKLVSRAENIFAEPWLDDSNQALLGFEFNEVTREVEEHSDLWREVYNYDYVYFDFARNIIPQSAVPASFAGNSNNTSGTVNRITAYKDHVYIVGRFDMHVLSNYNQIELVNTVSGIGNEMETIFPLNDKLFIGSRASMEIYDISDPATPVHDYFFAHATSCDPVLATDEAAYISLRTAEFSPCPGNTNAVVVLNIANLENPQQVGEIEMRSPYGMALIGDKLYVGEGEQGLSIFDASDRHNIILEKYVSDIQAFDVIEHPTRQDVVLIAGPNGLDQYSKDNSLSFQIESRIQF